MSGTAFDVRARAELRAVASKTAACHAERCNKDRCGLDLTEAPSERVIVDMDCDDLKILDGESRCDYVFIGREHSNVCVVPIELKSGGLKASAVLSQLAGGATLPTKLGLRRGERRTAFRWRATRSPSAKRVPGGVSARGDACVDHRLHNVGCRVVRAGESG